MTKKAYEEATLYDYDKRKALFNYTESIISLIMYVQWICTLIVSYWKWLAFFFFQTGLGWNNHDRLISDGLDSFSVD